MKHLFSCPKAERFDRPCECGLDALTRDAERYHWLRESLPWILDDEAGVEGAAFSFQMPLETIEKLSPEDLLDAVVDAGIATDAAENAPKEHKQ